MQSGGARGPGPSRAGRVGAVSPGTSSPFAVLQFGTQWEDRKVCRGRETWRVTDSQAEGESRFEGGRATGGGGRPPRPNAKLELATSGDRRKELEIPRLCEGRVVGRKALRRRRKPRRSRRRHPQRTLRIRHGFASFGRYYFAPEKKNKYKKGLDIKRRQILFSLEGGGGGGDGRGNAEQMRPEASRSPRPRLGRGRSHSSRSLFPHPRSPRPPTAPSFPVPAYLAVLGSSLYLILRDYRGLLSPGIATSQEFFSRGRFGAQLASVLLVATSG